MSEPPKPSQPTGALPPAASVAAQSEGNPAFRMMGLPRIRAKLPSRNWSIFLAVVGSFSAAVIYDKREKKRVQQKWCNAVSHISEEMLPQNRFPRKLAIYLSAPPGDGLRAAREHFQEYVKPLLVAAAIDWDVVEGRKEGGTRAGTAAQIRKIRRQSGEVPHEKLPEEMIEEEQRESIISEIRERFGIRMADERGGVIVIGRHTWKEYIRGIHEGWLGPLDAPKQPPVENAHIQPEGSSQLASYPAEPEVIPEPSMADPVSPLGANILHKESNSSAADDASPTSTPEADIPTEESREEPKPKPKPNPMPPFIIPASYPSASLSPSTPSTLPPTILLPIPHLLGFFNFPIRIYRFLNRRYIADEIGLQVATILLSPNVRPYNDDGTSFSASDAHSDSFASAGEIDAEAATPWEQQRLLLSEENDWHKSAYKPNPPEDEHKERPWSEAMVIDQRIGNLMRTPEEIVDVSSLGNEGSAKQTGEDGRKVRGNSRDWTGGAVRPERVSWGAWLKEAVGLEVEDPQQCKGWEHGNVGTESD